MQAPLDIDTLLRGFGSLSLDKYQAVYHSPNALAASIVDYSVALKALVNTQGQENASLATPIPNDQLSDELADLLLHVIALAGSLNIQLSEALAHRLAHHKLNS